MHDTIAAKANFGCIEIEINFQIKIRDSKYGPALVIQTLETGGGYTLGFRVDPPARLVEVYKELDSLFTVYSMKPIFGVTYEQQNVNFTILIEFIGRGGED